VASGLKINIQKTLTIVFGQNIIEELMINSTRIENVTGLVAYSRGITIAVKRRIARATAAMAGFKTVWNNMYIGVRTKLSIIGSCVMSVLLYACVTWTLRKRDIDSLMAFEMKCYRSILQHGEETQIIWVHLQNG